MTALRRVASWVDVLAIIKDEEALGYMYAFIINTEPEINVALMYMSSWHKSWKATM